MALLDDLQELVEQWRAWCCSCSDCFNRPPCFTCQMIVQTKKDSAEELAAAIKEARNAPWDRRQ